MKKIYLTLRAIKMPTFLICVGLYLAIIALAGNKEIFNYSYIGASIVFIMTPFMTNKHIPKRMLITAIPGIMMIINFLIKKYQPDSFIYLVIGIIIFYLKILFSQTSKQIIERIKKIANPLLIYLTIISLPFILIGVLWNLRYSLLIIGLLAALFFIFDFRRQYVKYIDLKKTYRKYIARKNGSIDDYFFSEKIIKMNCNSFCSRQTFINSLYEMNKEKAKKLEELIYKMGYRIFHFFPTTEKSLFETFLDDYESQLRRKRHRKRLKK